MTKRSRGKPADAMQDAVLMMKRLANPARLKIARALTDGELSVGELEALLDIHQPTLSQQLADLREADIIAPRREAKQVFYRLADPRAAALVSALDEIFAQEEPQPQLRMQGRAVARDAPRSPMEAASFARIIPFDQAA